MSEVMALTTIIWDGKKMVADTLGTQGNMKFKIVKIFKVNDWLVGGAGDASDIAAFVVWLREGMKPEKFPQMPRDSITIIAAKKDGGVLRFEASMYPLPVLERFVAIGSGADFAIGALECGASAEQAMEIAKKYDNATGGELTVLHF